MGGKDSQKGYEGGEGVGGGKPHRQSRKDGAMDTEK